MFYCTILLYIFLFRNFLNYNSEIILLKKTWALHLMELEYRTLFLFETAKLPKTETQEWKHFLLRRLRSLALFFNSLSYRNTAFTTSCVQDNWHIRPWSLNIASVVLCVSKFIYSTPRPFPTLHPVPFKTCRGQQLRRISYRSIVSLNNNRRKSCLSVCHSTLLRTRYSILFFYRNLLTQFPPCMKMKK